MEIVQKTIILTLDNCDINHGRAFIMGAHCNALKNLLLAGLEDESGIRELFELGIERIASNTKILSKIG